MNPLANTENDPFLLNHVCAWTSYRFSPNISSSLGYLDDGYIYMWGTRLPGWTSQYGEGVAQIITLQAGAYDVVMAYKRICPDPLTCNNTRNCDHLILDIADDDFIAINNSLLNPLINVIDIQNVSNFDWAMSYSTYTAATTGNYKVIVMPYQNVAGDSVTWVAMDNIHIVPRPIINYTVSNDICNNNVSFSYTSSPLCDQTITSILWTFGDGTSLTTNPSQTSVSHEYTTSGTFTTSITVYYNFYGQALQITHSQQVISHTPFSISGNRNTCDTLVNYTLINGLTNTNYHWSISPANAGTIISGNGTNNITITWNNENMDHFTPAILTAYNIACNEVDTIKVWKCCVREGYTAIHDETITTNLPGGIIYMNGTITINANINATNCRIHMGQEAKIIVNPPYTFNINATIIEDGCNYMWDGIFVTNSQSSVITSNNSSIKDAYNAIVSENGGIANVSNTAFLQNLKGIVVKNYAGSNPISISNCVFYSTSDLNGIYPVNLHQPYPDRKGQTGIEILNMNSVTVGNTAKATKNKFSYLDYGIYIANSNVNVYNNNFINMPATPTNGGCGVRVIGDATTQLNVNIGGYNSGNTIYTNFFNNCFGGITTYLPVNIKILCDTFTNSALVANSIASNSNRKIDFTKNRIENSNFGLYVTDFINTRLVADSNSLYNVINGLNASNATQQECYGATIRKNTITGSFTTGITLSNVKARSNIMAGPNGYERQIPYIWANTITLGSYNVSNATIHNGIRVENGDNTCIEDNILNTTPTYSVTNETQGLKLNGIYVLASPKTSLCSNTINKFGMGIRMSGYCAASHLKSNSMNNNYYGVRLDAATIGNQGITQVRRVNRNSWNIPFVAGRYRVQGSVATATTWTYDGSVPSIYSLLSSEYSVAGGFTSSPIINPVPQGCGYDGIIWVPNGGVGGTDPIANGVTTIASSDLMQNFSVNPEENQYYQAANYYVTNQNDNMAVSADAFSDVTDNPIQTTSIILFDQVNKLIADNRIDKAIEANNSIVPANMIERNQQTANAIYLQSWAKGRFELTSDERTTLIDIANQPHIQGGYGVFTAWVMLYRTPQDQPVKPKSIIKPFGIGNNEITIYPNPAREQVTVTGALDILFVVIYDIQGRELIKTLNNTNSSEFIINTSKLNKGVYFIKLVRGDFSDEKVEKIIIE